MTNLITDTKNIEEKVGKQHSELRGIRQLDKERDIEEERERRWQNGLNSVHDEQQLQNGNKKTYLIGLKQIVNRAWCENRKIGKEITKLAWGL